MLMYRAREGGEGDTVFAVVSVLSLLELMWDHVSSQDYIVK